MEVEVTTKRNGRIVGVLHLIAEGEGETLRASFENKESGGTDIFPPDR
jgi:hypothetical protein